MLLIVDELEKNYYTTEQAIKQVGVSDATFQKDVKQYHIKVYRFRGHKNYYLKSDIEKLKQERNRIRPVDSSD